MTCKKIYSLLIEYHENSLDSNERKRVEQHLSECENCKARLKEIEQTYPLLAKETIPQPEESFWINFLPEVRSRIESKEKRKITFVPKIRLAFGLLSILLVGIISFFLFSIDRENIARNQSESGVGNVLFASDPFSYTEQLIEFLSSEGDSAFPVEMFLSKDERQNLDLTERSLEEDYLSREDLSSILSELNSEELEKLKENINNLQSSDIL